MFSQALRKVKEARLTMKKEAVALCQGTVVTSNEI